MGKTNKTPHSLGDVNKTSKSSALLEQLGNAIQQGDVEQFTNLLGSSHLDKLELPGLFRRSLKLDKEFPRQQGKFISCFLQYIEDHKKIINIQDSSGNTFLHYACLETHTPSALKLLALGVNPNLINKNNQTPLIIAATLSGITIPTNVSPAHMGSYTIFASVKKTKGRTDKIIEDLIDKGANVNFKPTQGADAMNWAIFHNNQTVVGLLLPKYDRMESKEGCPWYVPLIRQVTSEGFVRLDTLRLLIKEGASLTNYQVYCGEYLFERIASQLYTLSMMTQSSVKLLSNLIEAFDFLLEQKVPILSHSFQSPLQLLQECFNLVTTKSKTVIIIPDDLMNKYKSLSAKLSKPLEEMSTVTLVEDGLIRLNP